MYFLRFIKYYVLFFKFFHLGEEINAMNCDFYGNKDEVGFERELKHSK